MRELTRESGAVPAVCADGHVSYPSAFTVEDDSELTLRADSPCGACPDCGRPRSILAGVYRAQADGTVIRFPLPLPAGRRPRRAAPPLRPPPVPQVPLACGCGSFTYTFTVTDGRQTGTCGGCGTAWTWNGQAWEKQA